MPRGTLRDTRFSECYLLVHVHPLAGTLNAHWMLVMPGGRYGMHHLAISMSNSNSTSVVLPHMQFSSQTAHILRAARLKEDEKEFAVVCAVPVTAPGITYIYGRQSCDTRYKCAVLTSSYVIAI